MTEPRRQLHLDCALSPASFAPHRLHDPYSNTQLTLTAHRRLDADGGVHLLTLTRTLTAHRRLDADGGVHLLEANGDPLVRHYPKIGLSPGVFTSLMRLVMGIHNDPVSTITLTLTVMGITTTRRALKH